MLTWKPNSRTQRVRLGHVLSDQTIWSEFWRSHHREQVFWCKFHHGDSDDWAIPLVSPNEYISAMKILSFKSPYQCDYFVLH
jgi:hypothetical protein